MRGFEDTTDERLVGRAGSPGARTAVITAVRWGTTSVGLLWTAAAGEVDERQLAFGAALLGYSFWRTFRPTHYESDDGLSSAAVAFEVLFTLIVTISTGCWGSPLILALFTPVIAAGFGRGFWSGIRVAAIDIVTIEVGALLLDLSSGLDPAAPWVGELLLLAALAGYGRRLLLAVDDERAQRMGDMLRLDQANALLERLSDLADELPASFDFHETAGAIVRDVRQLSNAAAVVLLVHDDGTTDQWHTAMADGIEVPATHSTPQLPEAARAAYQIGFPQQTQVGGRFSHLPGAALYIPLLVRDRCVGLIAVEFTAVRDMTAASIELLNDYASTAALTIDNARRFDKIRAGGADQERARIARDLHDRLGQGVAYVAFELDRLSKFSHQSSSIDPQLSNDLDRLRNDARGMVRELRETLYDLRTDVTDDHDFISTVEEFLGRVAARSDVATTFRHCAETRTSIADERELWRITQEAIINAERHAQATAITVEWRSDRQGAELIITDDGMGMIDDKQTSAEPAELTELTEIEDVEDRFTSAGPDRGSSLKTDTFGYLASGTPPSLGRPSYGIAGMHERAMLLGATLTIESNGEGTTVHLRLGRTPESRSWTDGDQDETSPSADVGKVEEFPSEPARHG